MVGRPETPFKDTTFVHVLYFVNLISCSVTSYNVGPRIPQQSCLEGWHGQRKTIQADWRAGGHQWRQGTQWSKCCLFNFFGQLLKTGQNV